MTKLATDHWNRLFVSDIELSKPFTKLLVSWATRRSWKPAFFKQPELSQLVGPPQCKHLASVGCPKLRRLKTQHSRVFCAEREPPVRIARTKCHYLTQRLSGKPAVQPNPSLKLTRYGRLCKPGLWHMVHHHSPGLHSLPPRAA